VTLMCAEFIYSTSGMSTTGQLSSLYIYIPFLVCLFIENVKVCFASNLNVYSVVNVAVLIAYIYTYRVGFSGLFEGKKAGQV